MHMEERQPLDRTALITKAATYMKRADVQRIEQAYTFAAMAHEGQVRKSGEPYILHPLAVAYILVELQMDATTIVCGLLHDVIEDTPLTAQHIEAKFGRTCRQLVEGLTKLEKFQFKSKEEHQNENYRKMFIAMAQDIRIILIKLADRLHNMRTLKHQSEEAQRRIAEETLELFCPIAHRLGIATMRWEMEDIALRYLNAPQYYRIANLMQKKRAERERHIQEVILEIKGKLVEMGIVAELSGRPKHIYSIYKKMKEKNKQFNEIYDLLAIRIIVDNLRDCYATLGIIHTLWKPMPGRFKDYIAMPKPNMYQSLHTTVIGPHGEPTEVQIRTLDMHRTSEYGIAAHWAYKEGKEHKEGQDKGNGTLEEKMTFFRGILELQHDTQDAAEFMESLRMDFFTDLVYVFTPKGEVIELPMGSVPLDFAYRIHTEIGNKTVGAKVNGRIVSLDYKLHTGDIVEILTSKHSYGPSQDWLKITKSSNARSKIRQWFKREKREDYVAKRTEVTEIKKPVEELPPLTPLLRPLPLREKATGTKPTVRHTQGVHVKGIENLLVRFARCCNPVPGDDIIGYVTRGRGVSVHRSNCANLFFTDEVGSEEPHRIIEVEWTKTVEANYSVDIEITGQDRRGLLNEVLQAVSETKTNMAAVSGRSDKNKFAMIHMTILIRNTEHLQAVVDKIKRVRDVYSVQRLMQS